MVAKRSGASLGGNKKRARDDTAAKCEEVTTALKSADSLPESMRDMLSAGVAAALCKFKDDRHAYQTAVVGWTEKALGTIQASHEQSLAESKAKVDGAETEKADLEAAVTSAQDNLAKLQDASADAEMKSSNLEVGAEEKTGALHEAKAAEKTAGAEIDAAAGKKAELEALLAQDGQYAKWQAEAAEKKEANAFGKMLKSKSKFEPVLLQCLVPTLLVDPAARTDFDKLVLQHFQQAVEKGIATQAGIINAAEPTKAQRAAAVAEAQAALDTAKAAAETGAAAAAEAEAAVKQASAELKAAQKSLKEHGPAVKASAASHKTVEAALEEFNSGPLAAFQELRDRTPPVEEEPPAEAAAEAPADGA